ncbi:hypothetical protein CRUP_009436, partial [Coryphaenoides rupestris]
HGDHQRRPVPHGGAGDLRADGQPVHRRRAPHHHGQLPGGAAPQRGGAAIRGGDARGRALGGLPPLADPERLQLPRLHPKPVHQQRAAGLHQHPDEARRGARLRALPQDLLPARHLPARRRPGARVRPWKVRPAGRPVVPLRVRRGLPRHPVQPA